ncbi:MAG: sigma-54-dependent transcriptional regulator [Gammaproteobacteria bacterium]
MNEPHILIIDDEPDIRELLQITLQRMNMETCLAETIRDAKELLQKKLFHLCLTDMRLPDGNGLDLVQYIQKHYPQLPVAVITAHGNMDTAIRAMKYGAFDFISKPVDLTNLRQLINSALSIDCDSGHEHRMRHTLLGESAAMCELRSKISRLARSQAPVHISGESGSGKELVARLIHQQSPRNPYPFIAVNCGAIPHDLMESEFFGHRKGSFTGAAADKIGLFHAADKGTLFLDEVADLPPALQVKLLRAIQEKKIRPVGEQHEIPVDIRLLSATHRDLGKMVQDGEFRQDLYYRINVIELCVPPLRARSSDIPQLATHLLATLTRDSGMVAPKLSGSAIAALQRYCFPGNVRELENILERALVLYDGDCIEAEDLNFPAGYENMAIASDEQPNSMSNSACPSAIHEFNPQQSSLESYLEDIERQAILNALEANRWNKTAAAQQLGMSFRSLRYRLKKLNLE